MKRIGVAIANAKCELSDLRTKRRSKQKELDKSVPTVTSIINEIQLKYNDQRLSMKLALSKSEEGVNVHAKDKDQTSILITDNFSEVTINKYGQNMKKRSRNPSSSRRRYQSRVTKSYTDREIGKFLKDD